MSDQMLSFSGAARVSVLAVLLGVSLPSVASPTLDTSFGVNGIVEQLFPGGGGGAASALPQRDGRILAYGVHTGVGGGCGPGGAFPCTVGVLVRYDAQGNPDVSFGNKGLVDPIGFEPSLMQPDGKFVGQGVHGLIRYVQDGSPDPGFMTDGAVGVPWFAGMVQVYLARQGDGKIVVAGTAASATLQLALLRFNPDGSLDAAFNRGGVLLIPPGASGNDWCAGLAIQPDGKIVIAGSSDIGTMRAFTVFRYNPDGTADATFGTNGRASTTIGILNTVQVSAFVRQPGGRLIVAGFIQNYSNNVATDSSLVLAGFTPDGIPDAGFGAAGLVKIMPGEGTNDVGATVKDVKVQPDGKLLILLGSFSPGYPDRLMRLGVDGSPDVTFGLAGLVSSSSRLPNLSGIATQPDGNIVAVGLSSNFKFALERFTSGAVPAIEFYNAALDHYFLSMNPQEVDDLDLGVHVGWTRTGQSFQVFGSAASATGTSANPVCRFYIPPEHGDSHFFSADFRECQQVLSNMIYVPSFSGYVEETTAAFYVTLPDLLTGACPAATIPVYRLWNQRFDSNHRYTTSLATKVQMVARGYVAEGYGPNAVDMCAPQ